MDSSDDLGGGSGPDFVAGARDIRMIEKSIKQRWPMSDDMKLKAIEVIAKIINNTRSSMRARLIAVRCLVHMEGQNMQQEQYDQGNPPQTINLNVKTRQVVGELSTEQLRLLSALRKRTDAIESEGV